jgi:hypothetical protein
MKHKPFQSIYRQEFEVVEQRLGNARLYPHTDHEKKEGHGPGSRFVFTDHIPGPLAQKLRPNETEEQYDEILPKYDWDAIFAKREGGETRSKSNDKQ